MDVSPTVLLHTRQAVLRGVDPRRRASGFVRVRHGTYVTRAEWEASGKDRRHALYVRATVETMKVSAPLARESAAVLLGLPVIGDWPRVVHVLEEPGAGGRSSAHVARHGTRFPPDVVLVDGVAVTSVARTVVDLGRVRSFASALASADHALRHGMVTREALEAEVERLAGTRGIRRARAVVEHADGRSEYVGESLSRAQVITLELPMPVLQKEFVDDRGFVGRTDFWWPRLRLVGEFDGKVKLGRALGGDEAATREALWREKLREDRLRRLGNGVVRWTWAQALDRATFARLMSGAGVVPLRAGGRAERG